MIPKLAIPSWPARTKEGRLDAQLVSIYCLLFHVRSPTRPLDLDVDGHNQAHGRLDTSGFSAFFGSIFAIIKHGVGNIFAIVANLVLVLVFVALPVCAGTLLIMAIDWSLVLLGRHDRTKRLEQIAETELVQEVAPPPPPNAADEEAPLETQSVNAAKAVKGMPPKGDCFLRNVDGDLEVR